MSMLHQPSFPGLSIISTTFDVSFVRLLVILSNLVTPNYDLDIFIFANCFFQCVQHKKSIYVININLNFYASLLTQVILPNFHHIPSYFYSSHHFTFTLFIAPHIWNCLLFKFPIYLHFTPSFPFSLFLTDSHFNNTATYLQVIFYFFSMFFK